MAAQYDKESKGKRNLAFKPVSATSAPQLYMPLASFSLHEHHFSMCGHNLQLIGDVSVFACRSGRRTSEEHPS